MTGLESGERVLEDASTNVHRAVHAVFWEDSADMSLAVFRDGEHKVSVYHGVGPREAYEMHCEIGRSAPAGVLTLTVAQVHAAAEAAGTTTQVVDDSGRTGVPAGHAHIDMRHMSRTQRNEFRTCLLYHAVRWKP